MEENVKKMKTKGIIIFSIIFLLVLVGGYFTYQYFSKDKIAELEKYLKENYSKYVIDGSTSAIPLHEALEAKFGSGKEIKHSKTVAAFEDFVEGKIDILLAVDYLDSYFENAQNKNVEINKKEITKEALVFLRNKEFDQDSLTLDQVKKIFNKEITQWAQIDAKHKVEDAGDYADILPIYRNEDSGSGMALLRLLNKKNMDCSENDCVFINDMGGVINALAYGLEGLYGENLIAFNMYTFSEKQYHNDDVKTFKINGVEPNDETIYKDEYPIILYNYLYYKNDKAKEFGEKLYEYLTSDVGQKLIEENGYVPLRKQEGVQQNNNARNCKDNFVDEVCVKNEGYNEDFDKYVKITINNTKEEYEYFDTVQEYIGANSDITETELKGLSGFLDDMLNGIRDIDSEKWIGENITFKKQANGDILFMGGNCGGAPCVILTPKEDYDFGYDLPVDDDMNYVTEIYITKDLKKIYSTKDIDEYQLEFNIPIEDVSKAFGFMSGLY